MCDGGVAWFLAMALVHAAAGQVLLGDDDDCEARRAAVIAEMESRLLTVGEIKKPIQTLKFVNNLEYKTVGQGVVLSGYYVL